MSLGLSMITNNAKETIAVLEKYGKYFDKWFITVADKDKKQLKVLENHFDIKDFDKLQVSYFKWTDDFAEAREYNREQIDTTYWMWLDSDDTIINPEQIPAVVQYMDRNGLDIVQLKYDYAQHGNESIANHWRERIIRTDHDVKWLGAVHETLISPNAHTERIDAITVKHNKTADDAKASMERNKRILEKDWEKNKDPRTAHYLGLTYMGEQQYEKAVEYFITHIQTSGWDEEQYRSWSKIAECHYMLGDYKKALSATNAAVEILPHYPDAYYIKVYIYGTLEMFDKAIEWLKVAQSKPEPNTLSVVDPTLYKYRGLAMGAQCYLFSGKVKEAFALYQMVDAENPDFFTEDWKKLFEDAFYDQKAIDYTRYLLHYLKDSGGKSEKLLQALPQRIFADPRLNADRIKFFPKKKWAKGSIAYFCGQAAESWGPDTLDKGMGGSEEAVVYLSRELAKLGHEVVVFNDREEEFTETGYGEPNTFNPVYKPWTLLNPYDEFDTFVAWRAPENANGVKANRIFCDLHDTIEPSRVYACAKNIDKYFVKSKYHRDLYPELPDDKFVIIGNGIVKEQF